MWDLEFVRLSCHVIYRIIIKRDTFYEVCKFKYNDELTKVNISESK